jgi:ribonucleoside-diphosphate reductase alpha chain
LNNYNEFIHKRTYSKFDYDKNRREDWNETVERWFEHMPRHAKLSKELTELLLSKKEQLLNMETLSAMRTLWTSGSALDQNHIGAFNCAYTAIDNINSFSEILYILMHGTGVGLSVEERFISQLPELSNRIQMLQNTIFTIEDSKEGWQQALRYHIRNLYDGFYTKFDYSLIRPAGAPLKTFGGRASGHEPLKELLDFVTETFLNARGRKLYTWECADIACMIAQTVIVGGVRRSSLMILTDINDKHMSEYKNGDFYKTHPYRVAANISAVINNNEEYDEHFEVLFKELKESKSGERGIVNRGVIEDKVRKSGRKVVYGFGVNPCVEILLRSKQFCNLSEIVMRKNDTLKTLKKKVETAVLFAVIQSQLTEYNNLSKEWIDNAVEEKLVGVSITGIMDWLSSNYVIYDDSEKDDVINEKVNMIVARNVLRAMKRHGVSYYNELLDKHPELAGETRHECIFTVKPSGTASQLVGCSSGIKPEQSKYYIRRVRVDAKDPLALLMIEQGVPFDYENGQDETNVKTYVFSFYRESYSDERLTLPHLSVQDQLDIYKLINDNWVDHNPSATIAVGDDEWDIVKKFLLENKDTIAGISFYPKYDGYHQLMPYEEISEEEYIELSKDNVDIDFNRLSEYETTDNTEGAKTYACHGGNCEIV